jgi:outer membrane receptor protein involved in Fe transport
LQIKSTRERLLASTIIIGAAMAVAAPAFAQDASAPIQEVVVTGSRIPQPNLTAISPVTAVSNAEIKLEGTTRIEDLLNNLPQVFASQGSTISNGSNGTATVDLRGLGDNRTLVLIDGKRVVPGDPGAPAVDLNNIPALLVDRVEVDTGGASAVYGSDAVAGVVNFIMRKNFSGVQIDAQYSLYQHDNDDTTIQGYTKAAGYAYPSGGITDGYQESVTAIMGVNSPDGKGNLTAYASYRNVEAVLEADRDYTACTLAETNGTPPFACSGSGTTYPTRFTLLDNSAGALIGKSYQISGTGAATTLVPYSQTFNYGPYNYLQRPDTRYNFGAYGHYEISPKADVYAQLMFMDDDSTAQIAAGGSFGDVVYSIPCNYPSLSAAELSTFCGGSTAGSFTGELSRRNVEGGGRQSEFRHTSYRIQVGMKGDLDKAWSYDGYLQFATTIEKSSTLNYFSINKLTNSLSNCTINPNDGCVPYGAFLGGGVTQAQLNYLYEPGYTGGTTTEQVANFTLTGKLGEYGVKSPWADDGVGVALGTEYRREGITEFADAASIEGDLDGAGGASAPINGSFDVYELFAEARIPLANNKPFIESANLDLAYRFSDYSTAGVTDTYAAQGDWSPVKDVRFRASFQRAVRAPNILELFAPQQVVLASYVDPCAGTAPSFTLAQCERTGMTAAQYGSALNVGSSANQSNILGGGNPDLKPEIADTYSGGAVFTPSFLPGFSFTVDYFNIFVANVISAGASPNYIISQCADGSSYYCSQIHRDPTFGSLAVNDQGYVQNTLVNAGSLQTSGIDITGDYHFPLSRLHLDNYGSIGLSFTGTYLLSLETEQLPGSGEKFDCAGYYGIANCGTPNPVWRHQARVTWNTPWYGIQLSTRWRYFGSVKVDYLSSNPLLSGSLVDNGAIPDAKLGAQNYFDMTLSFKVKDNYTFRVGVENIFDKAPPIVGADECPTGACNGNVYSQVYDSLGRYIFVGLTATY